MFTEVYGRAKIVVNQRKDGYILIKDKLDDSFDTVPRPVKHVGSEKYLMGIWKNIKTNPRYLKDPVNFLESVRNILGK